MAWTHDNSHENKIDTTLVKVEMSLYGSKSLKSNQLLEEQNTWE